MMKANHPQATVVRREAALLCLAMLVGWGAFEIWGFRVGISNNEFHFPILLTGRHEAVFRGDALVGTIRGFASPMWSLLAWLPSNWPLERVLMSVFVASRILLAWAFGLLAAAFVPARDRVAVRIVATVSTFASAWILTLPLGADPVIGTYFSQTYLSVGLLVGALGAGFSGRPIWAAVLLGLGYDVNLMQANFAAGILVVHWMLEDGLSARATVRVGRNLAATILAGLPGFIAVARSFSGHGAVALDGSALSDFAAFHIPGHFFLGMKTHAVQLQGIALLMLVPSEAWVAGIRHRGRIAALSMPAVYAVFHWVVLPVMPTRFLFQLHLFRADVLAFTLAAALSIGSAIASFAHGRVRDGAIGAGVACLILTGNFASAFAIVVGAILTDRVSGRPGVVAAACMLAFAAVVEHVVGASTTSFAMLLLASPLLLPVSDSPRGRVFHVIVAGLMVAALSVASARSLLVDVRGASRDVVRDNYETALRQARATTPPTALFAVPPSRNSRPILQRGVYWSIWDGAGFLWSKGHEKEVLRRMALSGVTYTPGVKYIDTVIDREWAEAVCTASARWAAEGVTHVLAPVVDGKIDPKGIVFRTFRIEEIRDGGPCADVEKGGRVAN